MFGSVKIGTIGLLFLSVAIWMIYQSFGLFFGHIALGTTVIGTAVLLAISIRVMSNREVGLTDTLDESKVNVIDTDSVRVGDVGVAESDLKLSGRIFVNGQFFDAESNGTFIDDGSKIIVTKVNTHQIFVKAIKNT